MCSRQEAAPRRTCFLCESRPPVRRRSPPDDESTETARIRRLAQDGPCRTRRRAGLAHQKVARCCTEEKSAERRRRSGQPVLPIRSTREGKGGEKKHHRWSHLCELRILVGE